MKKTPAKGHTRKHTGTSKHTATKKHSPSATKKTATAAGHSVHTVAKHPAHAKARALALADGVACCSAEALAASLRLAGARVDDDDVLELHEATACCHDAGASILATLQAASESELAGYRPAPSRMAGQDSNLQSPIPGGYASGPLRLPHGALSLEPPAIPGSSLILGLELPGPHAVTVDDRGRWWSWGRPWDASAFRHAVIEEAWAVTWA